METIIIMDATAKRADVDRRMAERKILEELEKKKKEKDIQEMLEKEIARAARKIEESEFGDCELTYWMEDIPTAREAEIVKEVVERLSVFLRKLGYVVNDFHEYSRSWQNKRGIFGYLFFRLPR